MYEFYTCLLFSTDGYMSTLFTVRMVRSVQSIQVFDVSSCLLFFMSVYLLYYSHGLELFLPFLHGQDIAFCYSIDRKLMFLCLLLRLSTFSSSTLSTFFHSVSFCNSICRYMVFHHVQFVSCLCTYFMGWYLGYPFFRVRKFLSVILQAEN